MHRVPLCHPEPRRSSHGAVNHHAEFLLSAHGLACDGRCRAEPAAVGAWCSICRHCHRHPHGLRLAGRNIDGCALEQGVRIIRKWSTQLILRRFLCGPIHRHIADKTRSLRHEPLPAPRPLQWGNLGPEVMDGLVRSNDNLQARVLAPRYLGDCVVASIGSRVMEDLDQGINRPHLE